MGALLDKVEELARMSPDDGYVNEKDLVQNMRRMTALAQQIVYEFKQVEPSMEIIYQLRDDFEDLADRTITIVNNYETAINQTNQNAQQIINNLLEQTDFIRNNINELLNIGSNFESIATQIDVLLKTNETVVSLTEDFINLAASSGITFIQSGTDSWIEPRDRVKGKLYAEIRDTIIIDREPYNHVEVDPSIADHDGPEVKKFTIAPIDNGVFEIGEPATVASISATIEARDGHSVASAILFDEDDTVMAVYDWSKNTPKLTTASISFSVVGNLTITASKTYKIRVFDETGASDEYFSNPMTFVHPFYHGSMPGGTTSVSPEAINARIISGDIVKDIIEKKTTMNLIYTFTAAADVVLYPKEYGELENLTSINGDVLEQYTVTEMEFHNTEYLCYLNSGATFSENNYQLRLKFPDPEVAPPSGIAKIKPVAMQYCKEGTGYTATGINVTIKDANAPIKEIRVYDGKTLIANANHENFGITEGFTVGTCVLTWDDTKFAGFKEYRVEVEDTEGRVGEITSAKIDFIHPTYFDLILGNSVDKFELPMTDESLRDAIHRNKNRMTQMFPAPLYTLKESQGGQEVSGLTRVIRDVLIYPTSYGSLIRILDNTTDRLSEYKVQRVALNGVDYYVCTGPAPSPDETNPVLGVYNRTFVFK